MRFLYLPPPLPPSCTVCAPELLSLVYRTVKERDKLYQHSVFSSSEGHVMGGKFR